MAIFLNATTCGFAKTVLHFVRLNQPFGDSDADNSLLRNPSTTEKLDRYHTFFLNEKNSYTLDLRTFRNAMSKSKIFMDKMSKQHSNEKKLCMEMFSPVQFLKLTIPQRSKHSLKDCEGCLRSFMAGIETFSGKPSHELLKLSNLNVDISLSNNRKNKLSEKKQTKQEGKKMKREQLRDITNQINKHFENTAVERCLGNRQSFSRRNKERMIRSFESREDATARVKRQQESKKKINRSADYYDSLKFDKDGLEKEVQEKINTQTVIENWSDLARRYQIVNSSGDLAKYGGQVAKDYLVQKGINIEAVSRKRNNGNPIVRRSKKKLFGNEISIPTDCTNMKLKENIKRKIDSGEYSLGEPIATKKIKKYALKDDEMIEKTIETEGRKFPLLEIRKKTLKKQERYMRSMNDNYYENLDVATIKKKLEAIGESVNEDDEVNREKLKKFETTRNIQVWHDASVISNHGHIIFTVNILYDEAIFYTNDEFYELTNEKLDIQTIIEEPELYIIGQCRANDDQILYTETRVECLREINGILSMQNGAQIKDNMRMFHGDGPAAQFECGNQKGGDYFCVTCNIHSINTDRYVNVGYYPVRSLVDRVNMVNGGVWGRTKSDRGVLHPFDSLNKEQLADELRSRNLSSKVSNNKENMKNELKKELRGVQRVPSLLFHEPEIQGISSLNLQHYEITAVEPMHDLAGHTKNILTEFRHHLLKDEKEKFDEVFQVAFGNKDTLRACDYRRGIIEVVHALSDHIKDHKKIDLLLTLIEIQRILYSSANKRTDRQLLQLHNMTFKHFILLKEVFSSELKTLTQRKLYGKYFHNLMHAPIQYRLISGSSINCEDDERIFNLFKSITSTTSSHHPGNVIGNIVLRYQAEKSTRHPTNSKCYENDIERKYKALKFSLGKNNSFFSKKMIEKNRYAWDCHLRNVCDFLTQNQRWWTENEFGIEFLDGTESIKASSTSIVRHFRSSSLKDVCEHVLQCWETLEKKALPLYRNSQDNKPEKPVEVSDDVEAEEQEVVIFECTSHSENEVFDFSITTSHSEIDTNSFTNETIPVSPIKPTYHSTPKPKQDLTKKAIHYELQSKEAKTVLKILEDEKSLIENFDRAKLSFKTALNDIKKYNRYMDLLTKIQTTVLRKETQLTKEINTWETKFIAENNFSLPCTSDYEKDKHIIEQLNKKTLIKVMKKSWKINV